MKYTEEEVVALLRQKSKRGFDYLYENYSRAIYGVISGVIQDEDDAQDLLQEVFVKIWNNFSQYDDSKGRLYTWMLNIARNASIDKTRSKEYKKDAKNQSLDYSVNAINSSNSSSISVDHIGLDKLIDSLKEEHKVLVEMIYLQGYTQAEVAETLNIPLGTVKTRIRNAILSLREKVVEP
ncbi:MAG TPA: RNA polymerase sigma factor [Luteibaculaceae bacterium]|nr:RNA polymerase sigma factor [Luteibaculaceae bacterium]